MNYSCRLVLYITPIYSFKSNIYLGVSTLKKVEDFKYLGRGYTAVQTIW